MSEKLSKIFKSSKASKNPRPDLTSTSDADADATHPSEHNSVVLIQHPPSEREREERQRKSAKRTEENMKAAAKGTLDSWERMSIERLKRKDHDVAFTAYWGV